jgi:vacuolar-type H+-ATPase subunit B/Vma2
MVALPIDLAVVSLYLTTLGALGLFGAITIIGLGLMVGGLATMGDDRTTTTTAVPTGPTAVRQVVVGRSVPTAGFYPSLSGLELQVLRLRSQGEGAAAISRSTGVSEGIVSEKLTKLYAQGYTTESGALTEKGFDAIQGPSAQYAPTNQS